MACSGREGGRCVRAGVTGAAGRLSSRSQIRALNQTSVPYSLRWAVKAREYALETAGFVEIKEERVETTLVSNGEDEVLSAIFAGGPVPLDYSRFSPQV
jgi:hypothetical protein